MQTRNRGMTFIDVIVGSALILIVFLALMGMLRASILVASLAKARAGASSLADSQMEYLRGLSYDALGIAGGIPSGVVPQVSTVTMDGAQYTVSTYIQYIDDPADGLAANDTNGIPEDYKLAKVVVSYVAAGRSRNVTLLSNFSPPGLETTNGGGTLTIHVANALGAPVSGATVHIINTSTNPTIDFSTFSNVSGTVYLPGAATSTEYQVFVTKDGYSSAQTHVRDTTNQNPTPGYFTVVKNQTTTGTFVIDYLATLAMRTYSPPTPGTFTDTFTDESLLAATSSVDATGGALELSGGALSGTATSVPIVPAGLDTWGTLTANAASAGSVLVHVYNGSGALLPESILPGNAAGFSTFPVDLSGVSTSTYSTLVLGTDISTTDPLIVPKLFDWSLSYTVGRVPLPDVPFTLTGTKTIGSTGSGVPIYKTIVSTTTDSTGARALSLEWDAYALTANNYDIEDACPAPPYSLSPGSANSATLTLVPATTNRLLVSVIDTAGNPMPGASVTLSRTGYTKTVTTSACAGAYFGGLTTATDYDVTISKSGYTTTAFPNVGISGQTFYTAAFP